MHIGIVGLGLIGGSLLKKLHSSSDIFGFDTDDEVRTKAKQLGFRVRNSLPELMRDSEIILIATGNNAAEEVLKEVAKAQYSGLVTDVGSTKLPIHNFIDKNLDFVGGHPMAGSHLAGWESAKADIFQDASWALTLDQVKNEKSLAELIKIILKTGARVVPTFAKEHDAAVLISSHLSHALAAAYGVTAANAENAPLIQSLVGGSYRDLTRITLSPSDRTAEIIWPNRKDLSQAIDSLIQNLQNIKTSLKQDTVASLVKLLDNSAQSRQAVDELAQNVKRKAVTLKQINQNELIPTLKELAQSNISITFFETRNNNFEVQFVK